MSTSARRLASTVVTAPFQWGASGGRAAPRALIFPQSARDAVAGADSSQAAEARELPLPSVSAERLEAIDRQAFAEGYARGERAGEADAAERLAALGAQLALTIEQVAALRAGLMRRAERELVHLALTMAERIVRRQIEIDPDLLLVIARVAIDRLGEQAAATVRLHPADCAAVSRVARDDSGAVEVLADPAVPRGGCLIQSEFGAIDAGIASQIRELSHELLGVAPDDAGEEAETRGLVAGS